MTQLRRLETFKWHHAGNVFSDGVQRPTDAARRKPFARAQGRQADTP